MYTLTKKIRFETAHRIGLEYCGKCENPHGHSWRGKVTISGKSLNPQGMLMDFSELKQYIKPLEILLDHSTLLHAGDHELIELYRRKQWSTIVFEENPTSEVVARMIFHYLIPLLPSHIQMESVQIDETCNSECLYTRENHEGLKPVIWRQL